MLFFVIFILTSLFFFNVLVLYLNNLFFILLCCFFVFIFAVYKANDNFNNDNLFMFDEDLDWISMMYCIYNINISNSFFLIFTQRYVINLYRFMSLVLNSVISIFRNDYFTNKIRIDYVDSFFHNNLMFLKNNKFKQIGNLKNFF